MEQNLKVVAGSIVLAGLVIAGAIIYQPGALPEYKAQVAENPTANAVVDIGDNAVLGNAEAPVTVVIFGDYQCSFCKKAFNTAEKQMRDEYVASGQVKMVFRDYPLDSIHPSARPAAEAANCAGAQGKYWEYHDSLFAKQEQLGTLDYVALAGELQMNTNNFSSCVKSKTYAGEVQTDLEAGISLGVEGTPATFINGVLISGAYPYEAYKAEIEKALAQVK